MVISHVISCKRRKNKYVGLVISLLLISPNIIWVMIDRQVFGGDQSEYGIASITLYRTLTHFPSQWPDAMLNTLPTKGPGIAWIGQFFVPLGDLIGSIDIALLLSVCIVQIISVWLIYLTLLEIGERQRFIATLVAVTMSSAPLFVGLTHLYFTEPAQLLVTSLFLFLLSQARKLSPALVLGWLFIATSFALAIRSSAPIYVCVLWLAILGEAIWSGWQNRFWGCKAKKTLFNWMIGAVLAGIVIIWYERNLSSVIAHIKVASIGPVAAVWGKEDTFFNTLTYWLNAILYSFFRPMALAGYVVLLLLGFWFSRGARFKRIAIGWESSHLRCVIVVAIQITFVMIVFSFGSNRLDRFLLPLWPCLVILIGWSVSKVNVSLISNSIFGVFLVQFVVVHCSVFGVSALKPYPSWYVTPLHRKTDHANVMQEIIDRTCSERSQSRYLTIVAIDPSLWGDWFAPVPAAYAGAKRYGLDSPCFFGYVGGGFFGSSLEEAWNDIAVRRAQYIITNDPAIYPPSSEALNQSLTPKNHPELLQMIKTSGFFVEQRPLKSVPGILVFKRRSL